MSIYLNHSMQQQQKKDEDEEEYQACNLSHIKVSYWIGILLQL